MSRLTIVLRCATGKNIVFEPTYTYTERIFVSSMSFRWNFLSKDCYIANSLIVINRKMFQLVIDENRMVVTQKMTLIETFCGGTMYNVHIEVASLVYIYVYVGSTTIFSPVRCAGSEAKHLRCQLKQDTRYVAGRGVGVVDLQVTHVNYGAGKSHVTMDSFKLS